jgi:hypothetical protein
MDDHQKFILTNFKDALTDLDAVMEQISDEQLDWSEDERTWSIRQVLHHLADDGNVYTFIIERALGTPGCKVFFGGFPGNETWADRLGFKTRSVAYAWDLIHAQRKFIIDLVSHFSDRWENQVGYYDEEGQRLAEQTVEKIIIMLTEHMQEHVMMIKNILAANQARKHGQ